ncbi:hypothetical protein AF71_00056810 [Rhizobium sp. 57MFTsu3.2]|nr:hypothetical protein [Rhizobium sp. 57MFTsu3.2]
MFQQPSPKNHEKLPQRFKHEADRFRTYYKAVPALSRIYDHSDIFAIA